MRILVLGASGGCGQWAVRVAHARGHEVTAAVRSGALDTPARVVRLDPLEDAALPELLRAHDVVISAVGIRRRNLRNPWSPIASPRDLTARLAERLVEGLRGTGKRLVVVSAAGVGDRSALHPVLRLVFATSSIGVAYRDLEAMERQLRASELDWHALRPVSLTDGAPTPVEEVARYGLSATITRGAVGAALVDVAERDVFATRTPMIAGRSTLTR